MADNRTKWIRKGGRPDFVTDYAMTSPDEDAAETFAAYMTNTLKLWKVAIAQDSPVLMEKARAIEQRFVHDDKHRYTSDGATFDIPAEQAPIFFDRACTLMRAGKTLSEVEAILVEEYGPFISGHGFSTPGTSKTVARRLRSALIFGLLTTGVIVALLTFGSAAAVRGVYTYYFGLSLLLLIALQFLQTFGFALESEYSDVHFYKTSGLNVGLLVLVVISCLGGGWLLTHGYRTAFRLATLVPSILIATVAARWLLAAPDSKDEFGHLKFGTRSALIGLYLALISVAFSIASAIVTDVFPK